MAAALTEEAPGLYSISRRAAPSDEERTLIQQHRNALADALKPGDATLIEDRLHGFAYGFNQLRALDIDTFRATLRNYVEAIDHQPLEAVNRACRAWNKGRFKWAKAAFPPQAPELAQAVEEMMCELRMEERELRIILGAKVAALPPPPLTKEQRESSLARLRGIMSGIANRQGEHDRLLAEAEAERTANEAAERRAMAARLAASDAEREARRRDAEHETPKTETTGPQPGSTSPAAFYDHPEP